MRKVQADIAMSMWELNGRCSGSTTLQRTRSVVQVGCLARMWVIWPAMQSQCQGHRLVPWIADVPCPYVVNRGVGVWNCVWLLWQREQIKVWGLYSSSSNEQCQCVVIQVVPLEPFSVGGVQHLIRGYHVLWHDWKLLVVLPAWHLCQFARASWLSSWMCC